MSSQTGSMRKRKDKEVLIPVKAKDASSTGIAAPRDAELDALVKANLNGKPAVEWDYRIALSIITLLAFVTRFWGISHPNEVVFDEVHFGKVRTLASARRSQLTLKSLVCLLLPRANIFLRCPPPVWKASLRFDGLVCGIRRAFPLREHWRLIHQQQGAICGFPSNARISRCIDRPSSLRHNVGIWLYTPSMHSFRLPRPLRQCPHWTNSPYPPRCDSGFCYGL